MSPIRERSSFLTLRGWAGASAGFGLYLAVALRLHVEAYRTGVDPATVLLSASFAALVPPIALPAAAALVVSAGRRRTMRLLSCAVFVIGAAAALVPPPALSVLLLGVSAALALLAAFPYALLLSDVSGPAGPAGPSGLGVGAFALGALAGTAFPPGLLPSDLLLLAACGALAASALPFLAGSGPRLPRPPSAVSLHLARAFAVSPPLRRLSLATALSPGVLGAAVLLLGGHAHLLGDPRLGETASTASAAALLAAALAAPAAGAAARLGAGRVLGISAAAGPAFLLLLLRPSPSLYPILAAGAGAAGGAAYALLRARALALPPDAGGSPLGTAALAAAAPFGLAGAVVAYGVVAYTAGPSTAMGVLAATAAAGAAFTFTE